MFPAHSLFAGCSLDPSDSAKINCNIGKLAKNTGVSLIIKATPTTPGTLVNSASVTASTPGTPPVTTPAATATVVVENTCQKYSVDDKTLQVKAFDCGTGYKSNDANKDSKTPNQATCCVSLWSILTLVHCS